MSRRVGFKVGEVSSGATRVSRANQVQDFRSPPICSPTPPPPRDDMNIQLTGHTADIDMRPFAESHVKLATLQLQVGRQLTDNHH
jgi:hypothetical protein